MKDIVNKGQVMSLLIYAAYGLMFFVNCFFTPTRFDSFAIATLFFWAVTMITMLGLRVTDLRHSIGYQMLYIMSVGVFAMLSQLYLRSVFFILVMFAILWLTVVTFLSKACFRFTVLFEALCLFILMKLPVRFTGMADYTLSSFTLTCCGLLIADWVGVNIISILSEIDEEMQEHERSLDDLLAIVEAKHFKDEKQAAGPADGKENGD